MAQLELPISVQVTNSIHVDFYYGPYGSVSAANAGVPSVLRICTGPDGTTIGRTVGVKISGVESEYWWVGGTADGNLVLKAGAANGPGGSLVPKRQILMSDAAVNVPEPGYYAVVHYNIEGDTTPEEFPAATGSGKTYHVFNINGIDDDFGGWITIQNVNGKDLDLAPINDKKLYDYGVNDWLIV